MGPDMHEGSKLHPTNTEVNTETRTDELAEPVGNHWCMALDDANNNDDDASNGGENGGEVEIGSEVGRTSLDSS